MVSRALLPFDSQHPNVLALVGVCIAVDGTLGIVTEVRLHAVRPFSAALPLLNRVRRSPPQFLTRGSVFDLIHASNGPLPLELSLQILSDSARGMDYLHALSPPIIHRDLKVRPLHFDPHPASILHRRADAVRRARICWWRRTTRSRWQILALLASAYTRMR